MKQLADITADLPRFSDALERFTARLGLEIAGLDADHISLRCHQNTTAERWRRGLEQCGTLLSENMINGRPICLFKLAEPVCVAHWRFHIVELPWPGEKRYPMKAGSISKSSCPAIGNLKCPRAGAAGR
ncbi:protein yecM [Klebsiella pneumoniae]|uniref:Protein yecM n=1 Tax=Klebsiella pneumoniae TaxID=573 RepID=A0A4P0YAA4_KLEPN|nr:protein yecM [Klebsiella pneumoniae]